MVRGLFGGNIRDAIETLKPKKQKEYGVEFTLCYHPELIPMAWNQAQPEPTLTIGSCPIHDYICPTCGFGAGCAPSCDCPEMR
jgi:hypothetical protein